LGSPEVGGENTPTIDLAATRHNAELRSINAIFVRQRTRFTDAGFEW
jgi:hypothetical protein